MIDIGQNFSFYLDKENGLLVIETRNFGPTAYQLKIPIDEIIEYTRPQLKEGQKPEDLKDKPITKKVIFKQEKNN